MGLRAEPWAWVVVCFALVSSCARSAEPSGAVGGAGIGGDSGHGPSRGGGDAQDAALSGGSPALPEPAFETERICTTDIRFSAEDDDSMIDVGEHAHSFAVDVDNSLYVIGTFRGSIDFGGGPLASEGGADGFVAKYDLNCVFQWSVRFGAPDAELNLVSGAENDGTMIVVGSLLGDVQLGSTSLSAERTSGLLLTIDRSDGTIEKARVFGSAQGAVVLRHVGVDYERNLWIAGVGAADAMLDGPPIGGAAADQPFIANLSGSPYHRFSYALLNVDPLVQVRFTASGAAISGWAQGGTTVGFGEQSLPITGTNWRRFVAKVGTLGALEWGRMLDDELGSETPGRAASNVTLDSRGSVIIEHGSFGLREAMNGIEVPERLTKFDHEGEEEWSLQASQGKDRTTYYTTNAVASDTQENILYAEEREEASETPNAGTAPRVDLYVEKRWPDGTPRWRYLFAEDAHDWNWGLISGPLDSTWVGHGEYPPLAGDDVTLRITHLWQ
jgi:hypothetical protein